MEEKTFNSQSRNQVVLVDEYNHSIGVLDKMEAHRLGALHRAFSVFVFNSSGQLLLQQRAAGKYHGALLWTNTCCSHPQWGENVLVSATERLQFEMGLSCDLKFSHAFHYRVPVENGLIEHELDHVFYGLSDMDPVINPSEVEAYKWVDLHELTAHIEAVPHAYTYWFKMALPEVIAKLRT